MDEYYWLIVEEGHMVFVKGRNCVVLPNGALVVDTPMALAFARADVSMPAQRSWAPGQWKWFRRVTQEEYDAAVGS